MPDVRYLLESSLHGEHGPSLLRWLLARGADEFSVRVMALQDTVAPRADAFEDALAPYEHPMAARRVLGADDDRSIQLVRLWALTEASLTRLLAFFPHGLFRWPAGPDGWFEDLTVYRRGELVLGLVSHAGEGVLRLSGAEHLAVAALGVETSSEAEGIGW